MSITTDKIYRICVCSYNDTFRCGNHLDSYESIHIDDIQWKKVKSIRSAHGGLVDKIVSENIVNFVKQTTQLIFLDTNPTDAFKYCSTDTRFISTSNVRTIPTEIINNKNITQYKFLRCNSSAKVYTEIFNFLPEHLEILEIYYNANDTMFESFLTTNFNLPLLLKKIILDFRTDYGSYKKYMNVVKELTDKLYNKIKIPFGCELLINIQSDN